MTRIERIEQLALAGIGQQGVEATIGRALTAKELQAFRAARVRHDLLEAKRRRDKAAQGTVSNADAKAASLARRYNVEDIPPVADPMRRRHATRSALYFIRQYCTACRGGFLKKPVHASMRRIIHTMQTCVTSGNPYHIRMPRGFGKSSYVKGVAMWALATGRARFLEAVAANARKADNIIRDVWNCLSRSPRFAADFPEIAVFIQRTKGNPRKAASIMYRGESVAMQKASGEFHLPTVEIDGTPTPSSGATFIAVGFSSNIRGEVQGATRPDLIIFDDLQDRDTASNPDRIREAIATVKADFLGGDSHTDISAVLMTSTPIKPDDLSEKFAADPYWRTETYRLFEKFPACFDPNAEEGLWQEFARLWRHENAVEKRDPHPACNAFYMEHRAEMDAGAIVLNPGNFRPNEVSAIEHGMILYFTRGAAAFDAEYQMNPHRDEAVVRITPEMVIAHVSPTLPAATVPPNTVMVCAATDINPSYALSSVAVAFDGNRTATVIDWWLTPCHIPGNANDTEFEQAVYSRLVDVARELTERGLDPKSADFHWGIDASGNQFRPVTDFAFKCRDAIGFPALALLGRTDREFNPRVTTRKFPKVPGLNHTVLAWDKATRKEHIFFDKDVYEETAQKSFLSAIGAPGGVSIFGKRGGAQADHDELAMQICGEVLRAKTIAANDKHSFTWDENYRHDLGDAFYMCFAMAGFFGLSTSGGYVDRNKPLEWSFD